MNDPARKENMFILGSWLRDRVSFKRQILDLMDSRVNSVSIIT